jgi:hypothetical protein
MSSSSALAHPLMPTDWIISQKIELSNANRRSPTPVHPPAASPPHYWTQTTMTSTP